MTFESTESGAMRRTLFRYVTLIHFSSLYSSILMTSGHIMGIAVLMFQYGLITEIKGRVYVYGDILIYSLILYITSTKLLSR